MEDAEYRGTERQERVWKEGDTCTKATWSQPLFHFTISPQYADRLRAWDSVETHVGNWTGLGEPGLGPCQSKLSRS